jgi:hypothetical protein
MTYTLAGKLGKDIYGEIMYEIEMFVQSELHGLAALQWAICQDSLSRYVCKALEISKISHGIYHVVFYYYIEMKTP